MNPWTPTGLPSQRIPERPAVRGMVGRSPQRGYCCIDPRTRVGRGSQRGMVRRSPQRGMFGDAPAHGSVPSRLITVLLNAAAHATPRRDGGRGPVWTRSHMACAGQAPQRSREVCQEGSAQLEVAVLALPDPTTQLFEARGGSASLKQQLKRRYLTLPVPNGPALARCASRSKQNTS